MKEEEIRHLAFVFMKSNPRYMEYSIEFVQGALKSQGHTLTPKEQVSFFYYLTGHRFDVSSFVQKDKEKTP